MVNPTIIMVVGATVVGVCGGCMLYDAYQAPNISPVDKVEIGYMKMMGWFAVGAAAFLYGLAGTELILDPPEVSENVRSVLRKQWSRARKIVPFFAAAPLFLFSAVVFPAT